MPPTPSSYLSPCDSRRAVTLGGACTLRIKAKPKGRMTHFEQTMHFSKTLHSEKRRVFNFFCNVLLKSETILLGNAKSAGSLNKMVHSIMRDNNHRILGKYMFNLETRYICIVGSSFPKPSLSLLPCLALSLHPERL